MISLSISKLVHKINSSIEAVPNKENLWYFRMYVLIICVSISFQPRFGLFYKVVMKVV